MLAANAGKLIKITTTEGGMIVGRMVKPVNNMAADFTILEQNPFTVLDEEIGKIKVYATWLNGHCVYRKSSAVTRGK